MKLVGKVVAIPQDNIDTDQIVPGRYLRCSSPEELRGALFRDFYRDGKDEKPFPLFRSSAQNASILVCGENFGSGSSREHAVWALKEHGINAVFARSFGSIFAQNALHNRLCLGVISSAGDWDVAVSWDLNTINVDCASLTLGPIDDECRINFSMDSFHRYCLLHNIDPIGFVLKEIKAIRAYEGQQ